MSRLFILAGAPCLSKILQTFVEKFLSFSSTLSISISMTHQEYGLKPPNKRKHMPGPSDTTTQSYQRSEKKRSLVKSVQTEPYMIDPQWIEAQMTTMTASKTNLISKCIKGTMTTHNASSILMNFYKIIFFQLFKWLVWLVARHSWVNHVFWKFFFCFRSGRTCCIK